MCMDVLLSQWITEVYVLLLCLSYDVCILYYVRTSMNGGGGGGGGGVHSFSEGGR